ARGAGSVPVPGGDLPAERGGDRAVLAGPPRGAAGRRVDRHPVVLAQRRVPRAGVPDPVPHLRPRGLRRRVRRPRPVRNGHRHGLDGPLRDGGGHPPPHGGRWRGAPPPAQALVFLLSVGIATVSPTAAIYSWAAAIPLAGLENRIAA